MAPMVCFPQCLDSAVKHAFPASGAHLGEREYRGHEQGETDAVLEFVAQ